MKTKLIKNAPCTVCIIHDKKLKKTFKAIAKCLPTDNWNDKIGEKFATYRALNQRDGHKIRLLMGKQKEIQDTIKLLNNKITARNQELELLHNKL